MESLHRERILNNIWLLAEKTQWNVILEEKLQAYKIFNSKMIEDLKRVSKIKAAGHVIILAQQIYTPGEVPMSFQASHPLVQYILESPF